VDHRPAVDYHRCHDFATRLICETQNEKKRLHYVEWVRKWVCRDSGTENIVIDLIVDTYRDQTQSDVQQRGQELTIHMHLAPAGMTGVLQPLDY
jgi:hypothetical protein